MVFKPLPIDNTVAPPQLMKAEAPTDVVELGIVICLIDEHPLNASVPIVSMLLPNVNKALEQFVNALLPIVFNEFGKEKLLTAERFINAWLPIVSNLSESLKLVKELCQPFEIFPFENALLPTFITPSPISNDFAFLIELKFLPPIVALNANV